MAKIEITFTANAFRLDLNTLAKDRKVAKIHFSEIRALCMTNNEEDIEIVFSNGEIKLINYNDVDKIDADTSITSQQILFDKFDAKLFT